MLTCTAGAQSDKLEDAKAKAAIKAQIEADKAERKARAEREKAIRSGQPIPGAFASTAPGQLLPFLKEIVY